MPVYTVSRGSNTHIHTHTDCVSVSGEDLSIKSTRMMTMQNQNSRVSQSKTQRDDVSIKAADVVFHCAFREDAAIKVSRD